MKTRAFYDLLVRTALLFLVMVFLFSSLSQVAAQPISWSNLRGYFNNGTYVTNQGSDLWGNMRTSSGVNIRGFDQTGISDISSVNNIDNFVEFYRRTLNNDNLPNPTTTTRYNSLGVTYTSSYTQQQQAYTQAAFTILTMLGEPPGTSKSQAVTRFSEWETLVRSYASAGRVSFNANYEYSQNTLYWHGSGGNDIVRYNSSGPMPSVVFRSASGTVLYAIKRDCANPVGSLTPPPPILTPSWDYRHTSFTADKSWSTSTTTPPRVSPSEGTIQVSNQITNQGSGNGGAYSHRIEVRTRPPSGTWSSWSTNGVSNSPTTGNGGLSSSGSGRNRTHTSTYDISGITVNDTVVCFRARIDNFTGTSPSTVTSTGWRYVGNGTTESGTVGCIRVYQAPDFTVCPSYPPFSAFSFPFTRTVTLTDTSIPTNYNDPRGSSTSWGAWGAYSAWAPTSSTALSQTRSRSRSGTETERRDRHTFVHYTNSDGTTRTRINSTNDEWSETTPYSGGGFSNGTTVYLDYTTHYDNYPYDTHNPTILYDVRYTETEQPQRRQRTVGETQTQTRTRATATSSWSGPTPVPGSTSSSQGAWGSWTNNGTATVTDRWTTPAKTRTAPSMPPCFPRIYDIQTPNVSVNLDNPENPSNSSMSASIQVDFSGVPAAPSSAVGLREPSRVNFTYVVERYIQNFDNVVRDRQTSSYSTTIAQGGSAPYNIGSSASRTYTHNFAVSAAPNAGANVGAGDRICWRVYATNINVASSQATGTMRTNGSILSGSGQVSSAVDNCTARVVDMPYVSAFGADVIAAQGLGKEDRCDPTNTQAFISGLFDAGNRRGSGAQFAVQAMSRITSFSSAKMRNSNPLPLSGLSFANTGANTPGGMPSHHCGVDHVDRMPTDTVVLPGGGTSFNGQVMGGPTGYRSFRHNGNLSLTASGGQLSNNRHRTLYVYGDVVLGRDIAYQNTNWSNIGQIPSFYLIVTGNIYIQEGVQRLDGVYFAEGNIYTCSNGFSPVAMNQIFDTCRTPLQVNGSLSANSIFLNRYADSSLRSGLNDEFPTRATRQCLSVSAARSVCAAETINFSPEAYLVQPALPPTTAPGQSQYESITTLPPIL